MDNEKKKLDYNRLLDDWSEELFKMADRHADKRDCADTGSYHHGYHRGMHDAYIMAITKLNTLEGRKSKKYEIDSERSLAGEMIEEVFGDKINENTKKYAEIIRREIQHD